MMQEARQNAAAISLKSCEEEPIHLPGSIQPHGFLLVLNGRSLAIEQVSENILRQFSLSKNEVLGRSVLQMVAPAAQRRVEEHLTADDVGATNPLRLPLQLRAEQLVFDAVASRAGQSIVLELENPRPGIIDLAGSGTPSESYYRLIRELMRSQQTAESVEQFLQAVCRRLQALSGFDRVLAYRFAEDFHGEVVAEVVRSGLESYLGLHFPAGDIPPQARRLYELNWLRIISDVDYTPSPLVPQANPTSGEPLDMTYVALRSVSPMHLQYLKNMGVGASMSISLVRDDRLWGLIACHHPRPMYLPFHVRAACVTIGTVVSSQLIAKEAQITERRRDELHRKLGRLLQKVAEGRSLTRVLTRHAEELLSIANSTGMALCGAAEFIRLGDTPDDREIRRILKFLHGQTFGDVYATDQLAAQMPEAAVFRTHASGLLAIRFPERAESYWLFFRPEVIQTIRWGGDPSQAPAASRGIPPDLSPRSSFAEWREEIRGRSLPWSDIELEMAREIYNSVTLSTLRQAEELGRVNRALLAKTKEMEQFVYTVSHDLKSPLVTCQGFVGLMKEDVAQGDYDQLLDSAQRIENATRQMNLLIDDLLCYSRLGGKGLARENVDVNVVCERLRERFEAELREREATLVIEADLPPVYADPIAVERAFDNLLHNALKYACLEPGKTITVGGRAAERFIEYTVGDQGPGIAPEYHELIFRLFHRLDNRQPGTGVGLASVSKLMEQHQGEAVVESQPGQGATFILRFPQRDFIEQA